MYDYEISVRQCPCCHMPLSADDVGRRECAAGHGIVVTARSLATMGRPDVSRYVGAYSGLAAEHAGSKLASSQLGMCYVRLRLYDKALPFLERATEENWEDADAYFMTAVCGGLSLPKGPISTGWWIA